MGADKRRKRGGMITLLNYIPVAPLGALILIIPTSSPPDLAVVTTDIEEKTYSTALLISVRHQSTVKK